MKHIFYAVCICYTEHKFYSLNGCLDGYNKSNQFSSPYCSFLLFLVILFHINVNIMVDYNKVQPILYHTIPPKFMNRF
jgi:hypothetical protein